MPGVDEQLSGFCDKVIEADSTTALATLPSQSIHLILSV